MADPRQFLFANNATASLSADLTADASSLALVVGQGARFPSPGVGQIFKLTLQSVTTGAYEIVNCTSRTGDTLVIERASEGTMALAFAAATTVVQIRVTAETLEKLQEAGASGGGPGTGAPVGAPYLTYAANADLTAERVLAVEAGVLATVDDGSAFRIVVVDSGITNTKFRQSSALSVVGRGSDTTGSVSDIVAATDGGVLRRDGNTVGFGNIVQASVIGLTTALNNFTLSIASIQADITAIQSGYTPNTRTIATQHSLAGGGDLTTNRTLNLVNDVASPGANMLYGTNGSGTRGWYAQPVGGGGVTDHGDLGGLEDDDHPQYYNTSRGDSRWVRWTRQLTTVNSLQGGGTLLSDRTFQLVGDTAAPGNNMLYGTDGAGVRGWYARAVVITDHGGLTGLGDDDHTQYLNNTRGDARYPPLARTVGTANSLTGGGDLSSNRTLSLVGDIASPGNNMVYGTNASGVRGWYAAALGGVTDHGALTGLTDDDHTQYLNNSRGDARYPPLARTINTQHSLTGGGDLSGNRTLSLVNDVAAPGNNVLYGTNTSGTRGWNHTVDEAANALTIARRDTNGFVTAVRFAQTSANSENPTVSQFMVTNGTDNNMRKASLAHVQTALGVPNAASNLQLNSLGVGTAASGTAGQIRATGDITSFYSSDRRLKTNIRQIDGALAKVLAITGVTYDWTHEYIEANGGVDGMFVRQRNVGVIAQELEQVLPEVVVTRGNGYKAVAYDKIVALLIEAVKDLAKEVAR